MGNRLFARVMACLMAIIVPSAMVLAETHAAMIYTSGRVIVNGTGVLKSATIFAGDKLLVPMESAVTITAKGSLVTVAPGSSVTFQGDAVALEARSAVSITTTDLMAARVKRLTIAPAAKSQTRFQVVRLNGNVIIAANTGAVTVSDGSDKKTIVEEGKSATVPDPDAQVPPPAATGSAALSHTPAWVPAVVGLGAAGAAAGAAVATTGKPVSPVRP